MSNKDFFSFRESPRLDSTSEEDYNQNKSTHGIDYYFMFIPEEFIAKVFHRRKWFFDDFTGFI